MTTDYDGGILRLLGALHDLFFKLCRIRWAQKKLLVGSAPSLSKREHLCHVLLGGVKSRNGARCWPLLATTQKTMGGPGIFSGRVTC
jgi:hypothetical protein